MNKKEKKLKNPNKQKKLLRKCTKCGLEIYKKKDLKKFVRDSRCNYGRRNLCHACHSKNTKGREYYYEKGLSRFTYQGLIVWAKGASKGDRCQICNRRIGDGEIKRLARHHWLYEYTKKQVKENPMLGLKNTIVVCYPCHILADALRIIYDVNRWERIIKLIATMPEPMKLEFASRLRDLAFQINDLIGEDY